MLLLMDSREEHFQVAGSYSTCHSTVQMEQAAAIDWESQTQDLDTYSTVPDVLNKFGR